MRRGVVTVALLLAGCGLGAPAPECDPGGDWQRARLPCGVAVIAATSALPAGHPAITRTQFLYGSATPCCSRLYGDDEEVPVQGHVVFTYEGGLREYVDVSVWHGELSIGTPETY